MKPRLERLPLRARLVAGFVVVMLVLLTGAGAFVYWRVKYALDRDVDGQLEAAMTAISPLVGRDGRVSSLSEADATGAGWQVLDGSARVVDSGGPVPAQALVGASDLAAARNGTRTVDIGALLPVSHAPYRARVTSLGGDPATYLAVAVRRDHRDEALRELLAQLTIAGLGALVIATVVGDLLARAALRPVERYRRRAAEIATIRRADGLRLEVPPDRDDEVTRLGHTLNDMLAALERSMENERRFVEDASHELRTPLTLLSSRIQLARRRSRSVEDHELVLAELEVDVARLVALAQQLLELDTVAEPGTADLGRVVGTVLAQREQVTVARPATEVTVAIGPHALGRIVTNLVDNALLHGRPPVEVTVDAIDGFGRLRVEDAGDGMPTELLDAATARFQRSVEARSRPGAGLGLSLVERLVVGAGGELRLCHDGHHASYGQPAPVPCDHADRMTVSVYLPRWAPTRAERPRGDRRLT
jgi:signal transduction histidine kinase